MLTFSIFRKRAFGFNTSSIRVLCDTGELERNGGVVR